MKEPCQQTHHSARSGRRGIIRKVNSIVVPTLLLLIAINSFILLYQIWTLLPVHFVPSSLLDTDTSPNLNEWGEEIDYNSPEQKDEVKRRIRSDFSSRDMQDKGRSSAMALKNELDDPKNKVFPYDIVPRLLEQTDEYYGVVHQLPSVPKRRRMTLDQVHNMTYFLEVRELPNVDDQPLYVYNPMLLPLNKNFLDEAIINDLTLGEQDSPIAYVAAFRLSNFANCHGPGRGVPKIFRNYLGLALLDKDLNFVKDPTHGNYLDVMIDVNQDIFEVDWTPSVLPKNRTKRVVKPWMQDCQLIAARIHYSQKRNQLILLCNEYAWPVLLQREGAPTRKAPIDDGKHDESKIFFKNKYGRGLHLTGMRMPNELMYKGKNMHYFTAGPGDFGPGFLEVWAAGPHTVLPVNFEHYPFVNSHFPPNPLEAPEPEPKSSYTTIDEKRPGDDSDILKDRDSGSACCVPIQWDEGKGGKRKLLLGVSHTKTSRSKAIKSRMYNYVSRVYAFDPTPPFNIVARSGYFCLGFGLNNITGVDNLPHAEAEQSDNEQVWGATNNYKLHIRQDHFECPRIHFISGITEKIDDPDAVVISYGINDCYPRMLELRKEFLVQLLRPGS